MPKLIARYWGLLAAIGVAALVVPLVVRIFVVRWEPFHYCNARAPEGLPMLGEDVGVGWSNSFLPFGLECRYGIPTSQTSFHDFGTLSVVFGLLLLVVAIAGLVVRLSFFRSRIEF